MCSLKVNDCVGPMNNRFKWLHGFNIFLNFSHTGHLHKVLVKLKNIYTIPPAFLGAFLGLLAPSCGEKIEKKN